MTLPKSLIQRLKFIVRHDYANPNAKLSLNRSECVAILNSIVCPPHSTDIKTSEYCTTCFNDDNEIVPAEFVVITKYSRFHRHFCRHHFVMWFDIFTHKTIGASRFIHYEIKRLRKTP